MQRIVLFFVLAVCGVTAVAQEGSKLDVLAGVELSTIFDNREYAPLDGQTSGTNFAAQLVPWVGLQWKERNRLVAGVAFRKDFGRDDDFMSSYDPHFYYQYADSHYVARMGIFDRGLMMGRMSDIVHDEWYDFDDDHLMGAHIGWHKDGSHVEMAVTWDGQPIGTRREKFRVLSTAMRPWKMLYAGYDFQMTHLANDAMPNSGTGVVDYMQVLPFAGLRFTAFFDFDIRATWVYSVQRDRRAGENHTPMGGMAGFTMGRWGASLGYQFYGGDGQEALRQKYGSLLYTGNPLYGGHWYHKVALGYDRSFFDDTVALDVRFVLHSDGRNVGTQQLLTLGVKLEHLWKRR